MKQFWWDQMSKNKKYKRPNRKTRNKEKMYWKHVLGPQIRGVMNKLWPKFELKEPIKTTVVVK